MFAGIWEWAGRDGRESKAWVWVLEYINEQCAITPSAGDNCCNKCKSKIFNLEKEIVLTQQLY